MVLAKKFVLVKYFEGLPSDTDVQLITEELPPIKDGEFLAEAEYLTVDPYMRVYASQLELGSTMIGTQVAKITDSKHQDFPVGKYVVGQFGWRTHTISDGTKDKFATPYVLPDIGDLPKSLALGVLGMPGVTAQFGFLEICKPKAAETVVVTAAGGAVGSLVGQIAKIKGCRVIGVAGTDEKCEWIKSLGFDHAINYKTTDLHTALFEVAPKGVDCYFDNVGGEMSSTILQHMNEFGRISVCGSITSYNSDSKNLPKVTLVQPAFVFKQLRMEGFLVSRWGDRWAEAISQNVEWIKENKLEYRETVTNGFENMFKALLELFSGQNIGKAIVKV